MLRWVLIECSIKLQMWVFDSCHSFAFAPCHSSKFEAELDDVGKEIFFDRNTAKYVDMCSVEKYGLFYEVHKWLLQLLLQTSIIYDTSLGFTFKNNECMVISGAMLWKLWKPCEINYMRNTFLHRKILRVECDVAWIFWKWVRKECEQTINWLLCSRPVTLAMIYILITFQWNFNGIFAAKRNKILWRTWSEAESAKMANEEKRKTSTKSYIYLHLKFYFEKNIAHWNPE